MFRLTSNFKPTDDQSKAIEALSKGLNCGYKFQTLLGVTGSGKTFTMASVIEKVNRPALVISPNKVLATQLFQEFNSFFSNNSVGFFVSYYDYYQPEAYLPETDTYIAKDARINKLLDQLRHGAIQSVLTRRDFVVVSSVSCLYGIGDPEEYQKIGLEISVGSKLSIQNIESKLKILQYEKVKKGNIKAGSYFVSDEGLTVIMPDGSYLVVLKLKKNKISEIKRRKLRLNLKNRDLLEIDSDFEIIDKFKIYPAKFFLTERDKLKIALENIKNELHQRYFELMKLGKIIEAERLKQRTLMDVMMLDKYGYCPGIENYSRHLSFRQPGEPPYTILDYLPKDTIIFIDESHLTVPQIKAMAVGDRKRKEILVEYGWRLPSAIDNRPLTFEEFFSRDFQFIFVSATPGPYEKKFSSQIVEQLIRPTGILDPEIVVKPSENQIQDLIQEIKRRVEIKHRVLVLALTKKSAESLCDFLSQCGFKSCYLHSDIKTLHRAEFIKKLRQGEIDILVGVNLLREGLDLPEVSLVAILDADKEGFLRNTTTLIQAMGRAARHPEGKVILYADKITKSMQQAIEETERRRKYQAEYNKKHNIIPTMITKDLHLTPAEILGISSKKLEKEEIIELEEFVLREETLL